MPWRSSAPAARVPRNDAAAATRISRVTHAALGSEQMVAFSHAKKWSRTAAFGTRSKRTVMPEQSFQHGIPRRGHYVERSRDTLSDLNELRVRQGIVHDRHSCQSRRPLSHSPSSAPGHAAMRAAATAERPAALAGDSRWPAMACAIVSARGSIEFANASSVPRRYPAARGRAARRVAGVVLDGPHRGEGRVRLALAW